MNIIFSLLYTSIRPEAVKAAVQLWSSRAARPELIEFVMTHDSGDAATRKAMLDVTTESTLGKLASKSSCHEQTSKPGTCVKGWNLAAEKSRGHVLICMSDDFVPPHHWDHALMNLPNIGPRWASVEAVVRVFDGHVRDLCTLAIVTRRRYDKMGAMFSEGYLSIYSDTELTHRALMDGVLLDAPHLFFEHQHCDNNKRNRDAVDDEHGGQHRYKQGELLFNSRRAQGFPIDTGKNARHYLVPAAGDLTKYAAFVQCDREEHLQLASMEALYNDGVRMFFFISPDEAWPGGALPPALIEQANVLAEQVSKMEGTKVIRQTIPVGTFRATAKNPEQVETGFCNSVLDIIRESGFYHILFVQAHWPRGQAIRIDQMAAHRNPMVIQNGSTTVYVRADARFADRWTPFTCSMAKLNSTAPWAPPLRKVEFAQTV